MKKKHYGIIIGVIILSLAIGYYFYNKSINNSSNNSKTNNEIKKNQEEEKKAMEGAKPVEAKKAEETVKKLIDSIYFKKGTYEEYKALFSLPERVSSKEKFEEARSKAKITDKFGKEYKSSDEIAKKFIIEKKDNMTTVIFKSEDGSKENKWQVIEKDGKSYIYNAIAK